MKKLVGHMAEEWDVGKINSAVAKIPKWGFWRL
jgi:hypothetical protein